MGKVKGKASAVVVGPSPEERALDLMQEAWRLKVALDRKVCDAVYDPTVHVARRYEECKEELQMLQAEMGVERIAIGGFKFVARLQQGRVSVDKEVLVQELIQRGVRVEVVQAATAAATKRGADFWVREVEKEKGME